MAANSAVQYAKWIYTSLIFQMLILKTKPPKELTTLINKNNATSSCSSMIYWLNLLLKKILKSSMILLCILLMLLVLLQGLRLIIPALSTIKYKEFDCCRKHRRSMMLTFRLKVTSIQYWILTPVKAVVRQN